MASATISVTLANADSHFSEIERETGFKGAQVTIQFLFYDLVAERGGVGSAGGVSGVANPPDEITESTFPGGVQQSAESAKDHVAGGADSAALPVDVSGDIGAAGGGIERRARRESIRRCINADIRRIMTGGVGNLNSGSPFTSCDFTRASCVARGMFDTDSSSNVTRRFGGFEFVPAQIQVRGFGEKGTQLSAVQDNLAVYNDFVPLVYGTAWYQPPIVFARNDGNLTRMEVLLGMGEIERVIKVLVNGIEIPQGQSGVNMTATGWFNVVTRGNAQRGVRS